ncbi:MAG: tetratricopeptide repeat-containing sensor histidine kinase [Bacteroidota bacterium]
MNCRLTTAFITTFLLLFVSAFGQESEEIRSRIHELVVTSDNLVYDNPTRSLELSSEANKWARELKDDSLIAVTLNRVGSAHWSLGNAIEALEKIQESLQIAEINGYEQIMSKNYGNIGNVYRTVGLDLDAIGYYRLELAIQEKLNTPFRLFTINNDIGKAFLDINFYDSAHKYFDKAASYLDDNFIHLHSIFYFNLAETYFKQDEWAMTDSLLQITFNNAEEHGSKRGIIRANQLQAELDRKYGNAEKALMHAQKAVGLAVESNVKELIYICSKTLSNCYADLGNYEDAYMQNNVYEAYLDSVQNISVVNELELLNYYQRLFRVRVLEEKNTLNVQVAEQRRFIIYLLVGVLVVAIFMISVIIRRGRKIDKQAKELQELDAFKNKIFAIISHDLKSPIQAVSFAIEMFHEKLISKEEIESHLPDIKDKTSQLLDLLNNIFQWASGQIGGEALKKEEFHLLKVVNDLEIELAEKLEDKDIKMGYDQEMKMKLHSNSSIVRIVLRNLLVNAIKFSHHDTTIRIKAYQDKNAKVVEVIDEGIGMEANLLKGLFSMEMGSSDGTDGEKGNGIGLALCSDFIRELGGKIEVESQPGKGSTFRVFFFE